MTEAEFKTVWTRLFGGEMSDSFFDVAINSKSEIYAIGHAWRNNSESYSSTELDAYIAKLSKDGTLLWEASIGQGGGDGAAGIAIGKDDSVYAWGVFGQIGQPPQVISNGGQGRPFLAKYSGDGTLEWSSELPEGGAPTRIAVTAEGKVFAIGGGGGGHLYGFDESGEIFLHAVLRKFGSEIFTDIVVSGNEVYVGGWVHEDHWTSLPLASDKKGQFEAFIAKIDTTIQRIHLDYTNGVNQADSSEGIVIPLGLIGNKGTDSLSSFAIEKNSGDVLAFGTTTSVSNEITESVFAIDTSGYAIQASEPREIGGFYSADLFLAKYSASGDVKWVKQFGTELDDNARAIAVDSRGNVYLGGDSGSQAFLYVYSSDGDFVWQKSWESNAAVGAIQRFSSDNDGFIYAIGGIQGDLNGESSNGDSDAFVFKFSYLTGTESSDRLLGSQGNDEIYALDGNDTVYAGLGDDLIIGGDGKGNDKYYGGAGADTVKYTSATWGITVDLARGTAASLSNQAIRGNRDAANIGADRLYEIENVTAGDFNDVLSGNQFVNEIKGEDGNDRIDGKAGNDVLYGGAGNDSLTGGAGNDVMAGGVGDDTYDVDSLADVVTEQAEEGVDTVRTQLSSYTLASEVENLTYIGPNNSTLVGNSLDNQIVGGGRADTLDGGAGNDLLLGALGNDTLVAGWDELALRGGDDTLRGGAGNDTYEIHKSTALYDDIIIDELADRGAGTDTLKIYEDLTLGPDIDTVTRGAILNDDGSITTLFYVDGTATGSYTVRGQIEYIVNSGKDQFGEWTPLKIQTWYAGKSWKLDQSAAMTLGYGTARNDNLVGSSKNDVISGFSGNDTLTGGLGNDTLDGGGGSDTASYAERALAVIANLAEGTATIGAETDMLISIENLIGGRGNDELTGDDGTNILNGGGGNDTLDGGDSNDTLIGGAGNDRYRIHEVVGGNDTIQDSGGSDGLDWIDYGQDYVMDMARVGTQSRDLAVTFRDISTGDLLQTTTIKAQFSTSSKLGASAIEMFYGMEYDDGNLVYGGPTLKFVGGLVGDADHNIIVGLAKADIINGGGGMDVIFAGAGNDTVYGGTEDDVISGASGYDRLFGDAGNDQLRGDAGNDELTGGSGSDEFWFRFALDSSTNLDTITDFESGADKICLSSQLFHELNGQIDENNFLANQTGQAEDADDRLIFDTDTRTLYYDADGMGGEASVAFVTLTGVQSLSVDDIWMIG